MDTQVTDSMKVVNFIYISLVKSGDQPLAFSIDISFHFEDEYDYKGQFDHELHLLSFLFLFVF